MTHEKIFCRPDGTRHKIVVSFRNANYITESHEYPIIVLTCPPKKRKFTAIKTDDYEWRRKTLEQRAAYDMEQNLKVVSKEEILSTKLELWEKLKPTI